MAALYNRLTKTGCNESIELAIKAAPPNKKAYIKKEWLKTAADWANYARCHSALLLQVTDTNAVESWHSVLKLNCKAAMTRWSLCGLVIYLSNKALDYGQRAGKDFRSFHFSDASYFPGLLKLPYPVQRLVVDELKEGNLLLEEGKEGRKIKDEITCDCLFW